MPTDAPDCACCNATTTRAQLRARHGTPEDFEAAVWACEMVTDTEAERAIRRYRQQWAAAPEGEQP